MYGQHQYMSGYHWTRIGQENGQSGEKKKKKANKDPLLI
jgi:hypothetical protein